MLLAGLAWPSSARADVDAEHPLIGDTGYTLGAKELQIGILQSSMGLTDRLQLNSYLVADLVTFFNAGLKYGLIRRQNLAVAVEAWGGILPEAVLLGSVLFDWGAQASATLPLLDNLKLNLAAGYHYWRLAGLSFVPGASTFDGRIAWPNIQAVLELDATPNHLFFLSAGTPTEWEAEIDGGVHDFDATSFWSVTLGYQLSYRIFNARVDAGYGPSLLGPGFVGDLDLYLRFDR